MPLLRVLMRKARQTQQLLAEVGLSARQVAAALSLSEATVRAIVMCARDAGVDWPMASILNDDELQAQLYPPRRPRSTRRRAPDHPALHQQIQRTGVTLQLLWEECRAEAGDQAYRYTAFCEKYRAWGKTLKGGVRIFVFEAAR